MSQRLSCLGKKTNSPQLTLSSAFVCLFIIVSSALQTYCFLPVFPLAGCGVWKVRMPDARCLTWCLVTSWGLVGCHVPFSAHAFNSSLFSLYPNTSQGKKSHPIGVPMMLDASLNEGRPLADHWCVTEVAFGVIETEWLGGCWGWVPLSISLFYLIN